MCMCVYSFGRGVQQAPRPKKEQELEVLWYEKRFMGKALVGRTAVVLRQLPRDAPEDAWLPLTAERDVEVRLVLHASGFGAASIPAQGTAGCAADNYTG